MAFLGVPGYRVERKVAEGVVSEIFLVRELATNATAALKILRVENARDKAERQRLLREGKIGLALSGGSHLVHTITYGTANDERTYLIEDFIPGNNLRKLMQDTRRFPESFIRHVAVAMAAALQQVHAAGFFHNDVKPDNIMMDESGQVTLIDFGFAVRRRGEWLRRRFSRLEGSPRYLAPERIMARKSSAQVDLYALGCTLYELATGHTPFAGDSQHEILTKQTNLGLAARPIREFNKSVSPDFDELVRHLLAKSPLLRLRSAGALRAELARLPPVRPAAFAVRQAHEDSGARREGQKPNPPVER